MSERLYYQDAYTQQFTAVITNRITINGRYVLTLNHTYFYPTSGGQPFDRGTINNRPVVDVTIRPEDGAILHWLNGEPPEEDAVTAVIDWPRRFDHMQQHTGQHILSQAFIRTADAHTIGFHLGDESVTIDLNVSELSAAQLQQAEQLANQIVWEDRPIHIHSVTREAAEQMPLRKIPPAQTGKIRLIDIEDFDLTACGGTHVARTGGVGLIKVIKLEHRRDNVRVEFRCGGRALADYGGKNETIQALMAVLTTGQDELVTAVTRQQDENKTAQRTNKKLRSSLLETQAAELIKNGQQQDGVTIIRQVFDDNDGINLRQLGNHLIQHSGVVGLLASTGSKSQLLFCRSEDAPGDMQALLKEAFRQLGGGGGGGSAVLAQGGGPGVEDGRLSQILANIQQQLP
ncbi:MAG: DHHA1 domain-containing protein [Anaerolineae bacterium]